MKSTLLKNTLGLIALGLIATGAQASWDRGGPGHNGRAYQQSKVYSQQVDARQDKQMMRIEAGLRQGTLTRREYRGLMQEQHEIRAMERHFRADGVIDAREFKRLDHALDVASRNIQAEKHDRQARNVYGPHSRFN
jgi:uncharacterized membrane protein YebE (DUF533 family)